MATIITQHTHQQLDAIHDEIAAALNHIHNARNKAQRMALGFHEEGIDELCDRTERVGSELGLCAGLLTGATLDRLDDLRCAVEEAEGL